MSFVGGRGKKAPYETTHCRVPIPVKHIVDKVCDRYRERLEDKLIQPFVNDTEEVYLVSTQLNSQLCNLDEALGIARNILRQKKSAKLSIEKLLTALYDREIKL